MIDNYSSAAKSLFIFCFSVSVILEVEPRHVGELVCRQCGATITRQSELMNVTADEDKIKYKYEFSTVGMNTTVNVLTNPAGETFHTLGVKTAHLLFHGQASSDATWFKGMKWTICVCKKCGTHMGWYFQPEQSTSEAAEKKSSFVGLVLDKLISADCESFICVIISNLFISNMMFIKIITVAQHFQTLMHSPRFQPNDARNRSIINTITSYPVYLV